MVNTRAHHTGEAAMNALAWLAAGLATGLALAVLAVDQETASVRPEVRAAAARVAPAFVTFSSALH
jgi:hypothetical protein